MEPSDGEVDWLCGQSGISLSSQFFSCLCLESCRLPCSKPAQELVYLIVAAGLAIEWLWPLDISRQDTGLDPGLSSAVRKVHPVATGPRGTEPADHTRAGSSAHSLPAAPRARKRSAPPKPPVRRVFCYKTLLQQKPDSHTGFYTPEKILHPF